MVQIHLIKVDGNPVLNVSRCAGCERWQVCSYNRRLQMQKQLIVVPTAVSPSEACSTSQAYIRDKKALQA